MNVPATAVVWFRRDLRLTDNPALAAACEWAERVVALYVHSPEDEGDWRPGAASNWWLHHSLRHLHESLRAKGGALVIRRGPATRCLLGLGECDDDDACPAHVFSRDLRRRKLEFLRKTRLLDVGRFEQRRRGIPRKGRG